MKTQLILGDCIDKLKELEADSVDSIVTDPPYGLSFMGKKWDYDVPSQEIWEECLRVLKPGGHLLSFGGSRTYHRMAVKIEDAGFEIRDQIMWVYGSGFPKSHNIGKAVDALEKTGKSNPKALRQARMGDEYKPTGQLDYKKGRMFGNDIENDNTEQTITNDWEGWGTALKPAHEPIVMARKPLIGTVANNVLEWGVGGINIDGCRVGFRDEADKQSAKPGSLNATGEHSMFGLKSGNELNDVGRFPANIIFDEEAGKILDEQSGTTKSSKRGEHNNKLTEHTNTYTPPNAMYSSNNTHGDSGGASRFFYCPKSSKRDRNEGMAEEVGVFIQRPRREDGSVIYKETHPEEWTEVMSKKPRKEKTSLGAAEEILQERKIKGRDEGQDNTNVPHKARPVGRANIHPTVKPTELMKYLVRLVTPKGGIVLDPFMGSGSTGKAAVLEGMEFIGIEREREYWDIAEQRIGHINKPKKHTEFFE